MTFWEIFRFELRYQLRQPLFWIASFFLFLMAFGAISSDAVQIGGSIGKVNRNAPFVIQQLLLILSLLGVFVTTAFVASTVLRDFEHRTQGMFFTAPIKKRDYVLGRFTGAYVASVLLFLSVVAGILLGSFMPWLDPARLGPTTLAPYAAGLAVLVAPNLLLTGALFFAIATWTRSMIYTYAGVLAVFVGYGVAGAMAGDIENETQAILFDPLGAGAFGIVTRYWTVAERNTRSLELAGPFLANRLLWLGVALVVLALAYWRFSFTHRESRKGLRRRWVDPVRPVAAEEPIETRAVRTPQVFDRPTRRRQLLAQTRFDVGAVLRSLAFPIILGFGVLNMIGNSTVIDQMFGTPVYPVTHLLVGILEGAFLFVFIVITFYSGELVWREQSFDFQDVSDALPVPNWVAWGAKVGAMVFILLALLATVVLTGMGIQAWRGYTRFEAGLWLEGIFLMVGYPFLLVAILAIFLQVLTRNKYAGFLLMICYFIAQPVMSALHLDHNLYNYAGASGAPYSDMNGYGHFLTGRLWFYLYWTLWAVVLLVLIHLLWVRGREGGIRARLRLARQRLTGPVAGVLAAALVGVVAVGAYVFYNTNVLNEYVPQDVQEERQVRYEKLYKQYEELPQPRITAVTSEVDIYPHRQAVDIRGAYTLRNKTGAPIETLHVVLDPEVEVRRLEMPGMTLDTRDAELGYSIYRLDDPLGPGEERTLSFDVGLARHGFKNHGINTKIVDNGTFFNNFDYFPSIGYQSGNQLQDPNERRKHGLPPVERLPDLDDPAGRDATYLGRQSDWLDFETVVSTSADQIALAPGYLIREWEQDGRRYFHYRMDAPILGFWAYLSADWEVARDSWNDVAIEIYYDEKHPYNVERMIEAVKASLDYFTENFSPYQHRQVRIVEFPRYARFAQSFPNTIPFSESIGFIARLDDEPDAIDYVFYVTAHEVAHQWWAHQVIGGAVQGATVMSETLSQYSALMVMEKEYGRDHMHRFLKYELDSYLRGRGGELIEELPLLRVENQGYIHYRKGSLVMYALRDAIGEDALNAALAAYIDKTAFQEPPYTYSRELLAEIEAVTPEDRKGFLRDLFEHITLYDNQATEAVWRRRQDGRYEVEVTVASRKLRATGEGEESEVPLEDWVEIGVFGPEGDGAPSLGKVLAVEERRLTGAEATFTVVVDEEPVKAGVDPFNKLIDRNPNDNLTPVEEAGGEEALRG
jgi:ABC-2 type transport system permease protein